MKRSRHIRLILVGIASGSLAGCEQKPAITIENAYTNNFYVPGAGYYHAPFRQWYARPYNDYNPTTQQYYYGGIWTAHACESITNISSPTLVAAMQAQDERTDISRGGFGWGGGGYYHSGGYYGGGYHSGWGGGGWGGFGG